MSKLILDELKKRFSKNGDHRKRLNYLKDLKRKYPENTVILELIKIFKQKIYGKTGASFLYEKIADIFEKQFLFQNGIVEIEDVKFDLTSSSARTVFYDELLDLLCSDEYFKKDDKNKTFHEIMKGLRFLSIHEGPYQYNSVFLQPEDIVIDAGANMGIFSIFANHFYNCKCYAFEPVQSVIEVFKKNIEQNRMENAIEIIPYGLSDKECEIDIQVDANNFGASSFVRNPAECTGTEKIHCITLDQWAKETNIDKIDFIKADIEGAERYMLSGATEVLKNFAPKLSICTYHLPDDPQVLEEIISKANPNYKIEHAYLKLYAYVPKTNN